MSRSRILVGLMFVPIGIALLASWDALVLIANNVRLPHRADGEMLIVAHRGNMAALPEDTAEAIWGAAQIGAEGIEFDVHQSAEGTWWVMHDPTVDRTTDGTGAIHEMTDAALARLHVDAGPGFDARQHSSIAPPRLTTVLGGLGAYGGRLYIDLQHAVEADPADLAGTLTRAALPASVLVICRTEEDVTAVHQTATGISAILRPQHADDGTRADGLLLEAVVEASSERVRRESLPVTTFTDERFAYLPESLLLRRAWAAGADAFLTKRLAEAMTLADELSASDR